MQSTSRDRDGQPFRYLFNRWLAARADVLDAVAAAGHDCAVLSRHIGRNGIDLKWIAPALLPATTTNLHDTEQAIVEQLSAQ